MEQMLFFGGAIIVGLALLAWSSDRFVDGASGVAKSLGISPLVIGLTVVAFSTSAPEILVSAVSAWQGNNGIAIGNAIGSNIANMTLVLGVVVLIMPLKIGPQTLHRETPLLLIGMLFAFIILVRDDVLSRVDGAILMSAMVLVIFLTIYFARRQSKNANKSNTDSLGVVPEQSISG